MLTIVLWALAALVVGAVLGGGVVVALHRAEARDAQVAQVERTTPTVLDAQVVEVVQLLRQGALVVGPHDEVLCSNSQARQLGVCRGDRILVPELLDSVRQVRASARPAAFDVELSRGVSAPKLHLNNRVTLLGDGTELVLVEDRSPLVRVDETRRDFVANIGHELKTPIGAISLLSEAIEDAADDPDGVHHFAGRMRAESARLAELVTQIIDLSRLQSDDPMLRAEPVVVDEIVDAALVRCQEVSARRRINLVRAGDRGLRVLGERHQLTDAIANLVQNAIVYSDPGARVAITVARVVADDESSIEVSVADNGIGISAEDQQRIFERFYRVDYARSRDNGGTGLGLSIVKHIAAVHGGSVNVWSKLGQGSTFTIRLPELTEVPAAVGAQN